MPASQLPIAALLWDLDRTLVRLVVSLDDIRTWKRDICAQLEAHGWRGRLSPFLPSLEEALSGLAITAHDRTALRHSIYYNLDNWEQKAISDIVVLETNAARFFRWRARGVPTAIVTNNGPSALEAAWQHLEVFAKRRFDELVPTRAVEVSRSHLRPAKPDPAILVEALHRLRVEPERGTVLMLGDSRADWEATLRLAEAGWEARAIAVSGETWRWAAPSPRPLAAALEAWGLG